MDIFIGGCQRYPLHVHSNRNVLSLVWTPVHHLVLYQGLCLCLGCCPGSESLLSHQSDLHALDLYLDQVEIDSANDDVLQMVEGLVILEVDVKAIFDSHLHLHGYHFGGSFNLFIG